MVIHSENQSKIKLKRAMTIARIIAGFKLRNNKNKEIKKKNIMIESLHEFCMNTSLHGLKYIGTSELSKFERAFFGVFFGLAFIISIIFTHKIYCKWISTPVIIGINPVPTLINEIPFPAVTICNMNQARYSKVKELKKDTAEYSILQTLCNRENLVEEFIPTRDYRKYESFILDVSQPCKDMILSCEFASTEQNCTKIFQETITDEGLCCAFNSVDIKYLFKHHSQVSVVNKSFSEKTHNAVDWSIEEGYPEKLPSNYYPRTALGVGSNMGLTIVVNAQINEYYCSSTNGAGFKVLLHNPAETPNVGNLGISLKVGHETRTSITPEMSVASDALKSMKKKYRQCLFSHESELSIYATYSRLNCEMECEANLLVKECQCMNYYMPRISPNINVCSLYDRQCVENVTTRAKSFNKNDTIDCNRQCIASCFELTYSTDSYSTPIGRGDYIIRDEKILNMSRDYIKMNIAVMHFYYREKTFRSHTKEEYIGFTDFLSNTGGLVSLFLGFSFISIIEILYFTTLRPIYATKKRKTTQINQKSDTRKSQIKRTLTLTKRRESNFHQNISIIQNNSYPRNMYTTRKHYAFRSRFNELHNHENTTEIPYLN